MSDRNIDSIVEDTRNFRLMQTNIQRIQVESAMLPREDRTTFEAFVLGWLAGLVPATEVDRAIGEARAYLGRRIF